MARVLVLSGGGIKSAVAAARYANNHEVILLHTDYGQASARGERAALDRLTDQWPKAKSIYLPLPAIAGLGQELSLSQGPSSTKQAGELAPMVLRGQTAVLLSVAFQTALREGASTVVTGFSRRCDSTHLGLDSTNPQRDILREVLLTFEIITETVLPQGNRLPVESPLMDTTFDQIIKLAQRFQLPLENTWSCLQSASKPCQRCVRCQERAEAFIQAGHPDPLLAAKLNAAS